MTTHPFYADAVLFLAELHSTTPQIIHNAANESNDSPSIHGEQIKREMGIVLNYTDAIHGRGMAAADSRAHRVTELET